jgi:hypothetical protein
MNASHPNLVTDWREVAMFLAGLITEEKPSYALLIFQVIADCTKPITHGGTSAGKEIAP